MRPRILLTNDDGIYAPGIHTLWKALHKADFADLVIIAPASERSGAGLSITCDRPIHIQKVEWPENTPAWSVDGTPVDCVKMGMHVLLKEKIDCILSGVNAGSNAGRNVLHSGTLGAVIEGAFRGIPGLAFSCEKESNPSFHLAEKYAPALVRYLLEHPLPQGGILNVTFPDCAHIQGFRLTRQGAGRWTENPSLHRETENGTVYWLGGKHDGTVETQGSDLWWLRHGYVTAVPLHVHELTDHHTLQQKQNVFENFLQKNCL